MVTAASCGNVQVLLASHCLEKNPCIQMTLWLKFAMSIQLWHRSLPGFQCPPTFQESLQLLLESVVWEMLWRHFLSDISIAWLLMHQLTCWQICQSPPMSCFLHLSAALLAQEACRWFARFVLLFFYLCQTAGKHSWSFQKCHLLYQSIWRERERKKKKSSPVCVTSVHVVMFAIKFYNFFFFFFGQFKRLRK